jgi:hypothetical protein
VLLECIHFSTTGKWSAEKDERLLEECKTTAERLFEGIGQRDPHNYMRHIILSCIETGTDVDEQRILSHLLQLKRGGYNQSVNYIAQSHLEQPGEKPGMVMDFSNQSTMDSPVIPFMTFNPTERRQAVDTSERIRWMIEQEDIK